MKTSRIAHNLEGSPTIEAAERVRKLLAQKKDVVRFDIGEPDFDTPSHISEAGIEAIKNGFTHYTSARGIPELRDALINDLGRRGLQAKADELAFYPGSKFSIYCVIDLLLDEGDEMIIQDPLWPTYASIIEHLRGVPVRVKTWDEDHPTRFPLEEFESRIGRRTKAVLLNTPTNPTGAVVPDRDIEELLRVCDRKGVALIIDLIYSALRFDDGAKDTIPAYDLENGNLVIVSGFSKEFAMTGWRLGYTVASRSFTKHLVDLQENTTSCPPSFTQRAAVAALNGPRDWQTKMNNEYKERRDAMIRGINKIEGWSCAPPPGAFYCFPRIDFNDSVAYSQRLLYEKMVSTVAGAYFGPSGESHLRLSFTTSKERISEGMERIREYSEQVKGGNVEAVNLSAH